VNRGTQVNEEIGRKNRFRPTSLLTGDMNTSGLNVLTEGSVGPLVRVLPRFFFNEV